jgi:hypothetical protein
VDALGLIIAVVVTAASVTDNAIGIDLLDEVVGYTPTVTRAYVDAGFKDDVMIHGAVHTLREKIGDLTDELRTAEIELNDLATTRTTLTRLTATDEPPPPDSPLDTTVCATSSTRSGTSVVRLGWVATTWRSWTPDFVLSAAKVYGWQAPRCCLRVTVANTMAPSVLVARVDGRWQRLSHGEGRPQGTHRQPCGRGDRYGGHGQRLPAGRREHRHAGVDPRPGAGGYRPGAVRALHPLLRRRGADQVRGFGPLV